MQGFSTLEEKRSVKTQQDLQPPSLEPVPLEPTLALPLPPPPLAPPLVPPLVLWPSEERPLSAEALARASERTPSSEKIFFVLMLSSD